MIKVFSKQLFLILFILVSMIETGCARKVMDVNAWQDPRLKVVWPPPPDLSRIRLVRVIEGPGDVISSEKSVTSKMFEFITGSPEDMLEMYAPHSIAADAQGKIFIADPAARLVHIYDLANREVHHLNEAGDRQLASPAGVALDQSGTLYVTDGGWASVFKYSTEGKFLGELDGKGRFKRPVGIAVNSKGEKLVADPQANRIHIFDRNDVFNREISRLTDNEVFNMPGYVAVDRNDNVYVTDTLNFTIRRFNSAGNYLGRIGEIGDAPGYFARPKGIATDSDRNIYVIDAILGTFQIFNQDGQLLLYVSQEGRLPGEVMLPSGIFIDRDDRIYIADTFNHRLQIFQYLKEGVQR